MKDASDVRIYLRYTAYELEAHCELFLDIRGRFRICFSPPELGHPRVRDPVIRGTLSDRSSPFFVGNSLFEAHRGRRDLVTRSHGSGGRSAGRDLASAPRETAN